MITRLAIEGVNVT